jgi:hypothetical protein
MLNRESLIVPQFNLTSGSELMHVLICSTFVFMSRMTLMALLPRLIMLFLFVHHCLLPCSSADDVDFTYNGFQRAANLILDRSASILDEGALRLITDNNNVMGHAFFRSPLRMLDSDTVVVSFSTTFVFQIMTIGRRSGGDGLAFVVVVSKALPRAILGSCLNLTGRTPQGTSPTTSSPSSLTQSSCPVDS